MYPETSGRSLEQMDTFFENGDNWNVFKASRNIKNSNIEDWRWTKKMKEDDFEELEQGRKTSTAGRSPEEEEEKGARLNWKKRLSNAGLM